MLLGFGPRFVFLPCFKFVGLVFLLCGKIIVFCLFLQVLPRVFVFFALNKVYVFQVVVLCIVMSGMCWYWPVWCEWVCGW